MRLEIPSKCSLIQPAIRMVLIEAQADGFNEIIPVLALQSRTIAVFTGSESLEAMPTLNLATKAGWEFGYFYDDVSLIYNSSEFGLVSTIDHNCDDCTNAVMVPVVCDWPQNEDQERLKPFIIEAISKASDKLNVRERMREKAK